MSSPEIAPNQTPIEPRQLLPGEGVVLAFDELQPLDQELIGVNVPDDLRVIACVNAANSKDFYVVDTRESKRFNTDFIIAEDAFFNHDDEHRSKGVWKDKPPIIIGRDHYESKFDYPSYVSRSHFEIEYTEKDGLVLRNLNPKNGTQLLIIDKSQDSKSDDKLESNNRESTTLITELGEVAITENGDFNQEFGYDRNGHEVARADLPRLGQDAILFDKNNAMYGVFDGLGSQEDSDMASELASQTIAEEMAKEKSENPEVQLAALEKAIEVAGKAVADLGPNTTATLAKVVKNLEGTFLVWASLGDSRIYSLSQLGKLTQISEDEGFSKWVFNVLGKDQNIEQKGIIEVAEGDTFILITDGITGDKGEDIIDEKEFLKIVQSSNSSALDVAKNLIINSRKRDDKSVVVIKT